jgi:outer membrane protein assembly factor BamB
LDNLISIRPPAVSDWDGDGSPELLITVGAPSGRDRSLEVIRAPSGDREAMFAVGTGSDYSTPAVVDVSGDGKPDVVMQRWDREVVAYEGVTRKHLWTHPTQGNNMGGLGVADLDANGRPDIVAPSLDGFVYGLRGRDGFVLWKTPIGRHGTRSPPTMEDLTGDGTPDVLVCTIENGLCVIDGRTGDLLWQVLAGTESGETESMGRPVVARIKGLGPLIVASMGMAGVAAFDWEGRKVRWKSPPQEPVQAGAIVADLDGDGELEVIVGTVLGGMRVLDLRTGERLWGVMTGERLIEADPAVADLDGDGILDILIAAHDKTLTAVNGRAIVGARRAWTARQGF